MTEQMLAKRMVLWMDGDLESGLQVRLVMGQEGHDYQTDAAGRLPANSELAECLGRWQTAYTELSKPGRLSVNQVLVEQAVGNKAVEDCRDLGKELEEKFQNWISQSPEFGKIGQIIREAVVREQDIVRIVIQTNDKQLHRLPWHKWDFVEGHRAEVCFAVSGQAGPDPIVFKQKGKVKILAIIGDDTGIDIKADKEMLERLPNTKVTFLPSPKRQVINQHLWSEHYDILFFAGHSLSKKKTGVLHINATDELFIDDLEYGLKKAIANGLQLAIFNSCDGLGLAYMLERIGIPHVVVMREPVPDRVAHEFLKNLLDSMVIKHEPFHLAVRTARQQLKYLENEYPCAGWLPLIFLRTWEKPLELYSPLPSKRKPKIRRSKKQLLFALAASVAIAGLVVGTRWHGHLQAWELQAYDFLMRQRPIEQPDPRLFVVRATAEDLDRLKEATLSDETILQILKKLKLYQPQAIGLDIYRNRPQGKGREALLKYMQGETNIFSVCSWPNPNNALVPGEAPPVGVPGTQIAFANTPPDPDGVERRDLMRGTPPENKDCPADSSFGYTLATQYLEKQGISPQWEGPYLHRLGKAVFPYISGHDGGYHGLLEKDLGGDQKMIDYRPFSNINNIAQNTNLLTIQYLPDGSVKKEFEHFIKNKIVLIGYDNGKKDVYSTPYGLLSGVWIQTHLVSHVLSAAYGERPPIRWLPWWGDTAWILFWTVIGGLIAWWFRNSLSFCLAVFTYLIAAYGTCLVFLINGIWLPLIPVILGGAMVFITNKFIYQALKISQSQ
jgi:CHASE2 domain-containing sensor protein